jgi:hypothetical protein
MTIIETFLQIRTGVLISMDGNNREIKNITEKRIKWECIQGNGDIKIITKDLSKMILERK